MLRFLVHLELICFVGCREGLVYILIHGSNVFLAPFVKDAEFSPMCIFGTFVKKFLGVGVWTYTSMSVLAH